MLSSPPQRMLSIGEQQATLGKKRGDRDNNYNMPVVLFSMLFLLHVTNLQTGRVKCKPFCQYSQGDPNLVKLPSNTSSQTPVDPAVPVMLAWLVRRSGACRRQAATAVALGAGSCSRNSWGAARQRQITYRLPWTFHFCSLTDAETKSFLGLRKWKLCFFFLFLYFYIFLTAKCFQWYWK